MASLKFTINSDDEISEEEISENEQEDDEAEQSFQFHFDDGTVSNQQIQCFSLLVVFFLLFFSSCCCFHCSYCDSDVVVDAFREFKE